MAPVVADEALPGLGWLASRERMQGHLARLLGNAPVIQVSSVIRRFVPRKRCVVDLEVTVAAPGGGVQHHRLIGKFYNRDQGLAVFETLQNLRRRGFGNGLLLVPEALGYDPDTRMLIFAGPKASRFARCFSPVRTSAAGSSWRRSARESASLGRGHR